MAFCRRHHLELSKVELFSFLIANQMQFEAKEPSHRAFASLGNTLEYFMDTYPLIPTYSQRCCPGNLCRCISQATLF